MRTSLSLLLLCIALRAADAPVGPVTVCEIVKDPAAYEGKAVPVVGRYSFRANERFVSEEACGDRPAGGGSPRAAVLSLAEDSKSAPPIPQVLAIDGKAVEQKLERIRRSTSLHKFRFGSPEYDRWALVYGQVERRADAGARGGSGAAGAPQARLLIRGDAAIVFISE